MLPGCLQSCSHLETSTGVKSCLELCCSKLLPAAFPHVFHCFHGKWLMASTSFSYLVNTVRDAFFLPSSCCCPLNSLLMPVLSAFITPHLWGPFFGQDKHPVLLGNNSRFLVLPPQIQSTQHFNENKLPLFYGAKAYNLHFRVIYWTRLRRQCHQKTIPDGTINKLQAQEGP